MYELKEQDLTPPDEPGEQRSLRGDGFAAMAMILLAIGLITLIVVVQIL